MYPADRKYSKEHEWVKLEGEVATIGITDFAQKELGEIVYVELPELNTTVEANETLGSVESVKAVSDVYSPISGEVIEVNETLEDEPELVNNDPHGEGWLAKLKPSDPEQMDELMSATDYQQFLEEAD